MPDFSKHAELRSAQRSVPLDHVDFALLWGQEVWQHSGRIAYHIGRRDAREALKDGVRIPESAIGLAVVMANDGAVITLVRSTDRSRLRACGRGRPARRRSWGRR